jgi:hypothetical protein
MLTLLPKHSETAGGHFRNEELILRGSDGTGKPEITDTFINFNGYKRKHLDHETFYIEWSKEFFKDWGGFCFCKTARKPYDMFVCLCLLSLANHITGFEFSSDGDKDDWEPAIEFYKNFRNSTLSPNLERILNTL